MKLKYHFSTAIFIFIFSSIPNCYAQENQCMVESPSLKGMYTGDCKNGYASGKGSAIGVHKYSGIFKNGVPDGKGVYNYDDSTFYTGSFLAGIREGKGELHHLRNGKDSVVKGYWSADVYRGKKYVTYIYNTSQSFDLLEISPSEQSGNTLTFQVSTNSGSPDGSSTSLSGSGSGFVLGVASIVSLDQAFIRKLSDFASGNKYYLTYQINTFPAHLLVTFTNDRMMELELYKAANWTIRLFVNK